MGILEDVFRADPQEVRRRLQLRHHHQSGKGDLEIWRNRTIVADGAVEDENEEIALSEAEN